MQSNTSTATSSTMAKLAVRRWWAIMLIVFFITYSLAYLDRANYGFTSAAGINSDLGISKGLSSLIGALFFLVYFFFQIFFFQIPGAIYAERRSVKRLVFWSLILWGGCAGADGHGQQHSIVGGDSLRARRSRSGRDACDARVYRELVHQVRARACQPFLSLGNPVTVCYGCR